MPRVDSLEDLEQAAAVFEVADLGLVIEPGTLDAARRSLHTSGLLLLGEVHGRFYNNEPRRFSGTGGGGGPVHVHEQDGSLDLDLPVATEAVVPQRPLPWPMAAPRPGTKG